jgi:hypothetical protein
VREHVEREMFLDVSSETFLPRRSLGKAQLIRADRGGGVRGTDCINDRARHSTLEPPIAAGR